MLSLVCSKVDWIKEVFDAERNAQREADRATEYGSVDPETEAWWADFDENNLKTAAGPDLGETTTNSSSSDDGGWSTSGKDDSWSEVSSIEEETKVELDWNKNRIEPKKPKYGW